MNRKTALILLGTACLFALMSQSSAAKGKPATDAQTAEAQDDKKGDGSHGQREFDFRKLVVEIFDKYGVDPQVRDNILNDIKVLMQKMHKEKGGYRKKRPQANATTGDATKPVKA